MDRACEILQTLIEGVAIDKGKGRRVHLSTSLGQMLGCCQGALLSVDWKSLLCESSRFKDVDRRVEQSGQSADFREIALGHRDSRAGQQSIFACWRW